MLEANVDGDPLTGTAGICCLERYMSPLAKVNGLTPFGK